MYLKWKKFLKICKVHFLFAWRYFMGKHTFQAIQFIAWVSIAAIAIGTAALIIILSVSNGFSEIVKGLYSDFYADVSISAKHAKFFSTSERQLKELSSIEGVYVLSKVIENRAILANGERQAVVLVKGVDSNYYRLSKIVNYLKRGQFNLGNRTSPSVVIGVGVEDKLNLFQQGLGDTLQLYAVGRSGNVVRQISQLNNLSVVQAGAFSVQQEFDEQYVFSDFHFAQYLFDLDIVQVSSIELGIDLTKEAAILNKITSIMGPSFLVENKYQQNKDLYKIMQTEKWIIFAILSIIMVVASFNLVGSLTMLVLEKQKDIYVLNAMGARPFDIQKIFLLLSGIMAFTGAIIGGSIASLICWLQETFHFIKLEGASFVIDYYPIKTALIDYVAVVTLVVLIALLAGWIPAKRAGAKLFEKIN